MRNKAQRKMWIFLITLVVLGVVLSWSSPAKLSEQTVNSINALERVELNGSKQWISIRGINTNNPVLLFLHGGPGSANLALLRQQAPVLEQHFVVVNWDQRGAGKSFSPFRKESLTLSGMLADTHALVEYLKNRFGVEKIYLVGFSWGTVLGLSYAAEHPENLYAYISVSQEVNSLEGERISLAYVQEQARLRGNQQAQAELAGIDPELYTTKEGFKQLQIQRKWLLQYGGVYSSHTSYAHEIRSLLTTREYSLFDFALWPLGSSRSLQQLFPEVMKVNFFEQVPQVHVPVYFLAGRHDYNTPFELVEIYYTQLDAPAGKQLIWFEDSAHAIMWDEPDLLSQTFIEIEQETSP